MDCCSEEKNSDGSNWISKSTDYICSAHFIGNKKSDEETSPSYAPTIFPDIYKVKKTNHEEEAINRHRRFMRRRQKDYKVNKKRIIQMKDLMEQENIEGDVLNNFEIHPINEKKTEDHSCQVDFFSDTFDVVRLFVCIRYVTNSGYGDAEIQTDIPEKPSGVVTIPNRKQFSDKGCGTPQKTFVDQSVGFDENYNNATEKRFWGFTSIKNDESLIDLAGVTQNNFYFLLKRLNDTRENCKFMKENRLLIFLIKLKTGLTFSAISVLFCVHRTTISRIFFSVLHHLSCATANLLYWPRAEIVQRTMPECFFPDYSKTRVIIDCTEFRIEIPATVDHRVLTYSNYKKGFTAKLLLGITPSGFISFKSKVAGGRKTDSQMTIESGLIDLLEDGDVVLADKGFPEIKKSIDSTGKEVIVVMPPFLEQNKAFTEEQTIETYNIARVRIHVERIMQRLRTYQILDKIPANLFNSIDDIVHVCCVLVNLQPSIIAERKLVQNEEINENVIGS